MSGNRILSALRSPALQNTGSTARDHLASERTFLAWLRTGLGFVALGVAVERFSQLELEIELGGGTSSLIHPPSASPHGPVLPSPGASSPQNMTVSRPPPSAASGTSEAQPIAISTGGPKARLSSGSSNSSKSKSQAHFEREQVLVGALLGTGSGSIAYGGWRYFSTLRLLRQGQFKPAYAGAGMLGLGVAGLAVVAWWGVVSAFDSEGDSKSAT